MARIFADKKTTDEAIKLLERIRMCGDLSAGAVGLFNIAAPLEFVASQDGSHGSQADR